MKTNRYSFLGDVAYQIMMKNRSWREKQDITGFHDIDELIAGPPSANLIVVGGRPSMGKSAFATCVAKNMAIQKNKNVVFFSLEITKERLVSQLISSELQIDLQDFVNGKLDDQDWEDLCCYVETLGNSRLIINDVAGIMIDEIYETCVQLKEANSIDLIIIDYLQLISAPDGKVSRGEQIEYIIKKLKCLANEINIPVIVMSQLSRAVDKRDDKRPVMSDFKETEYIGREADTVFTIYRDDYYNKESIFRNLAEIVFLKQRIGGVGKVYLEWDPRMREFRNYEGTIPAEPD